MTALHTKNSTDVDNPGILSRARTCLAVLGGVYVLIVLLLTVPFIQSQLIYMHALKLPWNARFDAPERHGLAPGKTFNFRITTPDNYTLGAWFILSDDHYHSLPFPPSPSAAETHLAEALRSRPTLLFLHGNSATRAIPGRVQYYSAFVSRLQTNVLTIDYRGFGDSQGSPSERGLATDARAAFDWLIANGATPENVLIVGHSLGTAVASSLAVSLSEESTRVRGLVLMSPFTSMHTLVDTYSVFGVFPVMLPLTVVPRAAELYKKFLVHRFDTLSIITRVKVPVLIVHAEDDFDISHTHSDALFDALINPFLPSVDPLPSDPHSWTREHWHTFQTQMATKRATREMLLVRTDIPHFGAMDTFAASNETVVLLKTLTGSHNDVGALEGTQEVIRTLFSLA
ncbi:Alpha/Beta hydrolase protein [Boletus reticuloceps]|uniref:Alpha/Beta hydrolase protein n=1 Tax=Boletus reticuloceps TaxID=495285 RepID=A0A8I2YID8_9AGAM|nr:Alpha/Beta hydrolase protein [Boletus reticuloceps]